MLYYLQYLSDYLPVLNVTRYITFRTAGASITALAIGLFLGPWMIRRLREFQVGQVIRQEGPATHRTKAGTPTMGGVLILLALAATSTLWAMRKLGAKWQTLHNFVYLAAILAPIHYLWSVKTFSPQPFIYALLAVALLGLRYKKFRAWWR